MSHWERFLAAGKDLALSAPELFPSVVALLEALAEDDALHTIVRNAFGLPSTHIPSLPIAVWSVRDLADVLCLIEPRLAELEDALDKAITRMSPGERTQAAEWARDSHWAAHNPDSAEPTLPACIAELFASLADERQP